jgi:hypothetical protein
MVQVQLMTSSILASLYTQRAARASDLAQFAQEKVF